MEKSKKAIYACWNAMKQRCLNPNNRSWKSYGGRGIKVCDRWLNSFEAFAADMGTPEADQWLDRIDVNGNYEPANCRWVDVMESGKNQRKTRYLTIGNETHHLAEWTRLTGIDGATILGRKAIGLSDADCLNPNYQQKRTTGQKGKGRISKAQMLERIKRVKNLLNTL